MKHLPRFRKAYSLQAGLAEREAWDRSTIESHQLLRLNQVWLHATNFVPYYRALAARHDLPRQFRSVHEFTELVPLLPKSRVRERPQDFLSERHEQGRWHRTGGSTGSPMNVYWGEEAYLEILRTRYRYYAQWGVDIFDRTVFLWGHSGSFRPGWKGRKDRITRPILDHMRNRLRLSVYELEPEKLDSHLRRMAAFQPASLYGYSSAVYLLAQRALERGVRLPSLKAVFLTAEPVRPHFVDTIEAAFGVPALNDYGSVESLFLAGESPDRTLRVREDVVIMETLPRGDGSYDLVPTLLTNPSFPLLRYEIQDTSSRPLLVPEKGFAQLHDVSGRDNDLLVARGGTVLHSARLDALFKTYREQIRRFRIHQDTHGEVNATVEVACVSSFQGLGELHGKLVELLEGFPVRMKLVESLPPSESGKHRFVVSDFSHGRGRLPTLRAPQRVIQQGSVDPSTR